MRLHTILFGLLSYLLATTTAIASPELGVDQGTYNFGTVAQGKKVQHSYIIRNNGDGLLQIKQLAASCGCTAVTPSTTLIPPGRTAEIKVVFDTANFSGKVQKTVLMTTNAAKTPNYTLVMEGTIVEEFQVVPRQISLGMLKPGVPREVSVSVTNHGSATRKLLSAVANSTSLQIKASIRKGEMKPGETGVVDLVIIPRPEAKVYSGYLHIATDHPQKKELAVPVFGSQAK